MHGILPLPSLGTTPSPVVACHCPLSERKALGAFGPISGVATPGDGGPQLANAGGKFIRFSLCPLGDGSTVPTEPDVLFWPLFSAQSVNCRRSPGDSSTTSPSKPTRTVPSLECRSSTVN